uniref:Homeobox protein prospero n=2 Tax=Cacopsylla melanoneura TaxID=428564 RepID=A0A8D8UKN7_9HEMI
MPPNFNGALSLLQQQVLQEQHPQGIPMPPHHHPHHHPHPAMGPHALSNAAAMYLGVRFMEQEARMAKEVAMAAEHHQQQQRNSGEHNGPPSQNHPQRNQNEPNNQSQPRQSPHPNMNHKNEFNERLSMLRNSALQPIAGPVELENLADVLKSEITSSLSNLIDSIIARFIQQRRMMGKQAEASAAAEQLNKDLLLASQLLDRKSQRTKVIDRGHSGAAAERERSSSNGSNQREPPRMNTAAFPTLPLPPHHPNNNNPENNINTMNLPQIRPSPMFQTPKTPTSSMNSAAAAAAAAIYSMGGLPHPNPFAEREVREERERNAPEQNEALSLVVQPKKKRHKVTDTRITPRTVSRILAQDNMRGPTPPTAMDLNKFTLNNLMNQQHNSNSNNVQGNNSSQMNGHPMNSNQNSNTGSESPQRPSYHPPPPPPPMLPVSLPTSVAIPNPSLHESQVFSPYSPFYNAHPGQNPHLMGASSPPGMNDLRDSPPLPPHPTMLHPALLAAAHGGSPDFNMRGGGDSMDMVSDEFGNEAYDDCSSLTFPHSATLTPMHLRKAKLMFFWVRYPSSAVLKMYFPDIKFNKNNTAQLVKWFSNFREFYYIQMEKYARQAVSEGVLHAEDLHVSGDCEIYRVLNLHYNRNNHIEVCGPQVPTNFRFVIEQTLREFFKAIQDGKDGEPSWKKSIYKIISRMDDPVPEYFKSPNFLEQLE